MTTTTDNPRPRPILDAIRSGAWKTALGTLVTAGVSFGILNADQATVAGNIAAALATIVTAVTTILGQLHVIKNAEPLVTPVANPHANDGSALTPTGAEAPAAPPTNA